MQTTNHTKAKGTGYVVPVGLIGLSLVPTLAGLARIVELASDPVVSPANARFVESPTPVVIHIVSVTAFSVVGAFQFSERLRRRRRVWHQRAGGILIPAGIMGAGTGIWLSVMSDLPGHDTTLLMVFRVGFGVAMAGSLLAGASAVAKRRYLAHGQWMRRGYAIGLGAGTQAFTIGACTLVRGVPSGDTRAWLMFAGWAINVAVAEWLNHNNGRISPRPRLATDTKSASIA